MADEKGVYYILYEPNASDFDSVIKIHNETFKAKGKLQTYLDIYNSVNNPFWVAINQETDEIMGFIAAKVKKPSTIYVSSLAAAKDYPNGEVEKVLVERVIGDAKELKAKYVLMHCRESSEKNRQLLREMGFEEKEIGKYRDGEVKYELRYDIKRNKEGKMTLPLDKKMRANVHPMPPPVEGYFDIRAAEKTDLGQVLNLHNLNMGKQRELSYFENILKAKDSIFLVALDSNREVVGYIACRPQRKKGFKTGPYTRLNFVSMAVRSDSRGWGIAKALIKDMLIEAKELPNIELIFGHVRGKNRGARKLYRRMGFRLRKIGHYEDDGDAKYLITKRIRLPSIRPYVRKYKKEIIWFGVGVTAHEVIHYLKQE
jgi:ribosomal protein S18 acetylase RimI-like enzyme